MPEPTCGSPYELHMCATPAFAPAGIAGQPLNQVQATPAQALRQRRPRQHTLHIEPGATVEHLDHQTPALGVRFNPEVDAHETVAQRTQPPGALLIIVGEPLHIALEL